MRTRWVARGLVVGLLAAAGGGGGTMAADAPASGARTAGPTTRIALGDLTAPVPSAWASQPPANAMRLVQFRVPAAPGSGDAELVVFYFGRGQGGSVDANIARWGSQFSSSGGGPVKPTVQHLTASGMPVTLAEFTGSYARGMGMGPEGPPKPDQTLMAAIVERPGGNVTIQLYGPRPTVAANREAFLAMVRGLR